MAVTVARTGRSYDSGAMTTDDSSITTHGMTLEDAERWCDASELEAASRGLHPRDADYWQLGDARIAEDS